MKAIASFATVGIMLLGLSSCNPVPQSNPGNPSPTTEPTTPQARTTVKIAPSSSTKTVLTLLAKAYEAKNPSIKVEFIVLNQSEGAIATVQNHLADMAGSSHQLKPEENNGKIQFRQLATDLLVVATHNSVTGIKNLTTENLRAIYKGEITNWKQLGGPNAAIIVLDRPEDESAKKLLRKYYLNQDKTTSKAVLLQKEGELIQTLQDTPYAIGAFSLAYSVINKLPVNRLSLNGVPPNLENFRQGKYSMVRQMGIVWQKSPSVSTQEFVDFIFSPEGRKVLQDNGFVPAS